jgi:spore coat protein SA
MVYHLLCEPFSVHTGLALSSGVANLMRLDDKTIVVCAHNDGTWKFGADRVLLMPWLSMLTINIKGSNMRGWRYLPPSIRRVFICRLFRSLLSLLEKGDVVWCHNWPYVAEGLSEAIKQKGAKLIYRAQNSLSPYAERRLFKSFVPDALAFNSEAMRREACQLMPYLKNTHVIYNGADEQMFRPNTSIAKRQRSVPVVLYVGRLVPLKGVHVLLDAMRILHEERVPALCRIVGSSHAGGYRDRVTSYIKSLHERRPENVLFEGFRSGIDIAEEYRDADVLCCPSIWQEPFGNVNIEAMACGLPVVASRVGGIPEIASDGGVILVEPNSAADLACALKKVLMDKELRLKTAEAGLASYQRRFTWTRIVKQHQELADYVTQF